MKTPTWSAMVLMGLMNATLPATAQQPSTSRPAVPMFSASDNAQFVRVDEGIFEIQIGRTIDLTDKKLTFMLSRIDNIGTPESSLVYLVIGGDSYSLKMAGRLDLKRFFQEQLRDYRNCWIDFIRATDTRGARPSATFRMECL